VPPHCRTGTGSGYRAHPGGIRYLYR
jgi:hypothetical protein